MEHVGPSTEETNEVSRSEHIQLFEKLPSYTEHGTNCVQMSCYKETVVPKQKRTRLAPER